MIQRSMRLVGALGSGETASAEEGADGLSALNTMLDSWSVQHLYVHQIKQLGPLALVSGQASYTIGPGGDFNVERPVKITYAFVRDPATNNDEPVEVTTERSVYDRLEFKGSQSSYPDLLFYEAAMPLGRISLYYTPVSAYSLFLDVYSPLASFAALATDVTLPPGYRRAIEYALAIELAPEYGKSASQELAKSAGDAVAAIKRINAVVPTLDTGLGRRTYNVFTDC